MGRSELAQSPAARAPLSQRLISGGASALLTLLSRPSERFALRLGAALGRNWARFGGPRIEDARRNLRIAFPNWSEQRRRRVLLASMENLGRCLVEFARMNQLSVETLRERVRVEGLENLEAAQHQSSSGGVVVMTAHFGNWEFFASAMHAQGYPISVVHRPRDNSLLDALVNRERTAGGTPFLPRGFAARAALEALGQGRMLAMPYDQNCTANEGVFAPFFGRLACSRVAPLRLAMRTGAPVVPAFLHREPDGVQHTCHFRPAIEMAAENGDRAAAILENARRWNRVLEDEIRRCPEQWLWLHRRWRTQPQGEPHPY